MGYNMKPMAWFFKICFPAQQMFVMMDPVLVPTVLKRVKAHSQYLFLTFMQCLLC